MQLSVKGKQIDVGDALRGHIEDQLNKTIAKYVPKAIEGEVHLSREGSFLRVDIAVHAARSVTLQSHAAAGDAYAAFDSALERMDKRLRRHKRRLVNHHKGREDPATVLASQYILAAESEEPAADETGESQDGDPVIVAETQTEIATLTVGEAVMRMDLADLPALLFHNRGHGGLNMVYRRPDGNIGWIDPPTLAGEGEN